DPTITARKCWLRTDYTNGTMTNGTMANGTYGKTALWQDGSTVSIFPIPKPAEKIMATDEKTTTELEAAVYRRLVEHLRSRNDVQNIDLMNLAGFCRNCLSNWLKEEADAKGAALTKDESREAVYGMPYEIWKSSFQ